MIINSGYDIIVCKNKHALVEEMKQVINRGWKPLGSAFIDDEGNWCQCIVILH